MGDRKYSLDHLITSFPLLIPVQLGSAKRSTRNVPREYEDTIAAVCPSPRKLQSQQ